MVNNDYCVKWKDAAQLPQDFKSKIRYRIRNFTISGLNILNFNKPNVFLKGLYCHYVFDDQLVQFENIIKILSKEGKFINTQKFIEMLKGEVVIDSKYFHLSFDDGFKNIIKNALPILKKYNVPALIFIPTFYIGSNLQKLKEYCLNITRYRSVIEILDWSDLRDLIKDNNFEIGSHTRTHINLKAISNNDELLYDEIYNSKKELENRLKIECKYISWPYGTKNDIDDRAIEVIKKSGYKACFGAFRGEIIRGKTDIFRISRHHFEAEWPISHVKYFALR